MAGVMSITSERDGAPVRVGYQVADLVGGLYLALGCVGGMLKSLKTRQGRAGPDFAARLPAGDADVASAELFHFGRVPIANGARHPVIAPSDIYPCADGKFIAVSPTGQQFWEEFCVAYRPPGHRQGSALRSSGEAHRERPGSDRGAERGIPRTLVIRMGRALVRRTDTGSPRRRRRQAVAQPLALLRKMVEPLENPRGAGVLKFLGNPIKYKIRKTTILPTPRGDHTREILERVCGYDAAAIDRLVAGNIVYQGAKK